MSFNYGRTFNGFQTGRGGEDFEEDYEDYEEEDYLDEEEDISPAQQILQQFGAVLTEGKDRIDVASRG